MAVNAYQTLNVRDAATTLAKLHFMVAQHCHRVILTCDDSCEACVLLSQRELEGMERALEILMGTSDGAAMRDEVMRIAAGAGPQPSVAASAAS